MLLLRLEDQCTRKWSRYGKELRFLSALIYHRTPGKDSPAPPILGCLQIIILCNTLGLSCSLSSFAKSATFGVSSVYLRKTGLRTASAWPILLIDCAGGTRSLAGVVAVAGETELGSRK